MSAEHHPSLKAYFVVFMALLVLTVVTVLVADLGLTRKWGLIVAMAIAACKATMVVLYFMHLKFEMKSIRVVVAVPVVLTAILVLALGPDIAGWGR